MTSSDHLPFIHTFSVEWLAQSPNKKLVAILVSSAYSTGYKNTMESELEEASNHTTCRVTPISVHMEHTVGGFNSRKMNVGYALTSSFFHQLMAQGRALMRHHMETQLE